MYCWQTITSEIPKYVQNLEKEIQKNAQNYPKEYYKKSHSEAHETSNFFSTLRTELWQGRDWAEFQEHIGEEQQLVILRRDDTLLAWTIVCYKKISQKYNNIKFYIYGSIRRGPVAINTKYAAMLIQKISRNCIYLLVDCALPREHFAMLKAYLCNNTHNFLKVTERGHIPSQTRILKLQYEEEYILAQMKKKGRYNIKLAKNHDIYVHESNLEEFYRLIQQTAQRQAIPCFSKQMFVKLLKISNFYVFSAYKDGQAVASAILHLDAEHQVASYMYGGMNLQFQKDMPSYLLQWEMLRFAKEKGAIYYDFCGISPSGEKSHYLSGVSKFKEMFGGEIIEYCPSFYFISSNRAYQVKLKQYFLQSKLYIANKIRP